MKFYRFITVLLQLFHQFFIRKGYTDKRINKSYIAKSLEFFIKCIIIVIGGYSSYLYYKFMKQNKVISIIIIVIIISFSFLGLVQLPEITNKSFSLIKTVIPFPGKTVLAVNRFIKFIPINNSAHNPHKKTTNNKENKNKLSGLLFYILSSVLVCNEKSLLLMLMVLVGLSVKISTKFLIDYKDIFIPPDKYYQQWRLKFLTPVQKCIRNLVDKYDINPIIFYGRAVYALKNPALCYETNGVRGFFYDCRLNES